MVSTARQAVAYCEARGVDPVRLAIQFCVAEPAIATTLVGSASPDNIRRNVASAGEPIDAEVLAEVRNILAPIQDHNFTRGRPENRDPIVA